MARLLDENLRDRIAGEAVGSPTQRALKFNGARTAHRRGAAVHPLAPRERVGVRVYGDLRSGRWRGPSLR